jgi:hypothetical protein
MNLSVTGGFTDLQQQLANGDILNRFADLQKQIDISGVVDRFAEIQKKIDVSGIVDRFAEVQKQIDVSGAVDRFVEIQKQINVSGVVDHFADLQKRITESDLMKLPNNISSALGHLNDLVHDDHARWDQIARSVDFVEETRIEPPIMPLRIPDMADQFERVLNTRAERDRAIQEQQFKLLGSIAEAGKKQNETMAGIASLQKLLVEESLENTRIQKVILLIAAISTALALAAVLFK